MQLFLDEVAAFQEKTGASDGTVDVLFSNASGFLRRCRTGSSISVRTLDHCRERMATALASGWKPPSRGRPPKSAADSQPQERSA